jgi:peptidylprolyl isomerase
MKKILILIIAATIFASCQQKEDKPTYLGDTAQFTESGLEYIFLREGNGPEAELGNELTTDCLLKVGDSTTVWQTTPEEPFVFIYSTTGLIEGFVETIGMMKEGDKIKVIIPPELGYGDQEDELIPANAYLSFEIDLMKVEDPKLWIADTLLGAFQQGGKEQGLEAYRAMKQDTVNYNLTERHLNVLGKLLENDGRLNDSYEVALLRVEEYPDSFGAHFALASVYAKRGEKDRAREEYNRCLEISPDNPAVLRMIEAL